jgi:hypothetical protein
MKHLKRITVRAPSRFIHVLTAYCFAVETTAWRQSSRKEFLWLVANERPETYRDLQTRACAHSMLKRTEYSVYFSSRITKTYSSTELINVYKHLKHVLYINYKREDGAKL